PRRLRRLGPHRGRARDLRARPARPRTALDRRAVLHTALAARRAPPRARLPARGPPPPGARPADVGRRERVDGGAPRAEPRRLPATAPRARARASLHGRA